MSCYDSSILMMSIILLSSCQSVQVDDKQSVKWSVAATLPSDTEGKLHPGLAGAVAGMHNERFIVGGGANFPEAMPWAGGQKVYHDNIYIFRRNEDGSLQITSDKKKLPQPIAYAACVTTDYGIVYAGGENKDGALRNTWLITCGEDKDSIAFHKLPDLPEPVTNAAASSAGPLVFIAGGENNGGVLNRVWMLNLEDTLKGWEPLPSLPEKVSHGVLAATLSADENWQLYIAGGRCRQDNGISIHYKNVYTLKKGISGWEHLEPLPFPLSAASGIQGPGGEWLIIGGDRGIVFEQVERLIAQISHENDSLARQRLIEKKALLQQNHPGFSKEVWMYDFGNNKWVGAGSIPFNAPVTTTAVLWHNDVYVASGEIKAGVRTPDILRARIIY